MRGFALPAGVIVDEPDDDRNVQHQWQKKPAASLLHRRPNISP